MFGKQLIVLRASLGHPPGLRGAQPHRQFCAPAALGAASSAFQFLAKHAGARIGAGSALLVGGSTGVAAFALSQGWNVDRNGDEDLSSDKVPWVRDFAEKPGMEEVLSPGQMMRKHPVGRWVSEEDHLFEAMVQSGQIKEFRCFYDTQLQEFHSVVELGKEVCGYPATVHGGLTAAIVDETFGGLSVAVWRQGKLGFRPPAYTARLEVDYKARIPAGTIILCTTQIEKIDDRKVWMRATVTDGKQVTYASARALFVAPRVLPAWLTTLMGGGKRK